MPRIRVRTPTVRRRRCSATVSPLDPQLFSRMNDFADELLKGERSGKYSPIEVAQWIEDYAAESFAAACRGGAGGVREGSSGIPAADDRHRDCRRRSGASLAPSFAPECCTGIHEQTGIAPRWRLAEAVPRGARGLGRAGESGQGCLRGRHHGRRNCGTCAATGWTGCRISIRILRWWRAGWKRRVALRIRRRFKRQSRRRWGVRCARRLRVRTRCRRGFGRGRRLNWRLLLRRRWLGRGCFTGTLRRRSDMRVSR